MKIFAAPLPGVMVIDPDVHRDRRGFFLESYHARKYAEGGITDTFVQDNHSRSGRGTLRGLHAQCRQPQAKLVRVVHGEIFDVTVDLRPASPTLAQWFGVVLSAENLRQCYVPVGFAHGFCVVSESAEIEYKCSAFYDPEDEISIRWNDPQLAIAWPVRDPLLSERDRRAPLLADVLHLLHCDG